MFVKHEQNTLVIIQYIACGDEPEHQTKFQEMKNLIKGQSGPKGSYVLLDTCMHGEEFSF